MITLQEVSQLLNELELKTVDGLQLEFHKETSKGIIKYNIGDKQYDMYITPMFERSIQISLIDAPLPPIESCKMCRELSCVFKERVVITCKEGIVSGF